jgi:hypothetical protein
VLVSTACFHKKINISLHVIMKLASLPLYYCGLIVASASAAILPNNQALLLSTVVVESSVNSKVPDDSELDPTKKRLLHRWVHR